MAPQRSGAAKQGKAAVASGPAARTRGAERRQQQAAADTAWPILLQHDSIRTHSSVVCKLLCCSKALAAAVAQHSSGQLHIQLVAADEGRQQQAEHWLRRNARLVRSLWDLEPTVPAISPACAAAVLSVGPHTLLLGSLRAAATGDTLPLLEQLPASRLTELELTMRDGAGQQLSMARVSAALTRLTALRHLALDRRVVDCLPLAGMSALTRLTSLRFSGPVTDLQHVPPQLLELDLASEDHLDGGVFSFPLELQHLTTVTALVILGVQASDALPPNLRLLRLDNCWSVEPLLRLTQLEDLLVRVNDPAGLTAGQLRQLSRLTSLCLFGQDDGQGMTEPGSAAAWPLLPLQRLQLCDVIMSPRACQHLAQLSGMTCLVLQSFQLPEPGSAQQLAAALRRLSGLQSLTLRQASEPSGAIVANQQREENAAGMQQLVQAIGSLQQLRDLDLLGFSQLAAAAGAAADSSSLTALTALTLLCLEHCDVPDEGVASIVLQMPALHGLSFSDNASLTNAALPAVRQLRQVTWLALPGTRVTNAGLRHLSDLTRLEQLELERTRVTDAGLCHLTGLTRLQWLSVPSCVTPQRFRWLKQRVPGLNRFSA